MSCMSATLTRGRGSKKSRNCADVICTTREGGAPRRRSEDDDRQAQIAPLSPFGTPSEREESLFIPCASKYGDSALHWYAVACVCEFNNIGKKSCHKRSFYHQHKLVPSADCTLPPRRAQTDIQRTKGSNFQKMSLTCKPAPRWLKWER